MLLLLLASTFVTKAETERAISLADCIQQSLRYNLDLRIAHAEPRIAEDELRGFIAGYYDPKLSLNGGRDSATQPGGVDERNRMFSGSDISTDRVSGGLVGRLPMGATYGLRGQLNDSNGTNAGGPVTNANGAVVAELRQPLLRDLIVDGDRLTIQLARRNLDSSELGLRGEIMRIVSEVETAYIDLIAAHANLRVRRDAETLAAKVIESALRRRRSRLTKRSNRKRNSRLAG